MDLCTSKVFLRSEFAPRLSCRMHAPGRRTLLAAILLLKMARGSSPQGLEVAEAEGLRRRAEKLRQGRDFEAALKMFEKVRAKPHLLLERARKSGVTLRPASQVLNMDPGNAKAHWGAGRILLEHAQPNDALPLLRRAAELARQVISL